MRGRILFSPPCPPADDSLDCSECRKPGSGWERSRHGDPTARSRGVSGSHVTSCCGHCLLCVPLRQVSTSTASRIFFFFGDGRRMAASLKMHTGTFSSVSKHRKKPSSDTAYPRISEGNLFRSNPRRGQRRLKIILGQFFLLSSCFPGHSLVAEKGTAA
jgi:hypothetical protein